MRGYFQDPEATARVLTRDGWLLTGDTGLVDEDGWFYFIDRNVNIIKRAGENVSATEVEDVLTSQPLIAEAAVVGVPDAVRDEAVKAFVVPVPDAKLTEPEVIAYSAEHLAPFKVPSIVEFMDALPRTSTAKVKKAALT
jgi:crotonobetaine/carnitine-CoA ligase